jgi:lysophospholipid acyltransferase (LPLAT)-like uncharacterized protein
MASPAKEPPIQRAGRLSSWQRGVARLAAYLLRALGRSWRVRIEGRNPLTDPERRDRAQIGAIWHRDFLMAAWIFRDADHCIGVSRSRDGDWISAVLLALGYAAPVRGSSSRGGVSALRGLLGAVRAGTTTAVLVDGPRGPALRVKPGVVALAQQSDRPITPVTFNCHPALRFRSWDGSRLPLPFARVDVAFAEPIAPPETRDRAARERVRAEVEGELHASAERLNEAPGR